MVFLWHCEHYNLYILIIGRIYCLAILFFVEYFTHVEINYSILIPVKYILCFLYLRYCIIE